MGLRHDNLVVARVAPGRRHAGGADRRARTVLFDTSASRALGFDRQVRRRLADVLKNMREQTGGDFSLRAGVLRSGDRGRSTTGPASGFGQAQLERIASRAGARGPPTWRGALTAAGGGRGRARGGCWCSPTDHDRGLGRARGACATRAKALAAAGVSSAPTRSSTAGSRTPPRLKALTTADLPSDGVVMDARLPLETIAAQARQRDACRR